MKKTFRVYNETVSKVDIDVSDKMTKDDIVNAVSEKFYDGGCYGVETIPDITDIEDETDESLMNDNGRMLEEYNEMKALLSSIADHVAVARDTSEQIEELSAMGFTGEQMVKFLNYSEEDVEEYFGDREEER